VPPFDTCWAKAPGPPCQPRPGPGISYSRRPCSSLVCVCARARARGLGGCDAPVAVPAPVFVRVRVTKAAEFATLQPTSRTVLRRCRCQLVIAGPTLCGRLGPARLLRHNDLVHAEHGDRGVCGELDRVPVFLLASHVRFGGITNEAPTRYRKHCTHFLPSRWS